ncbi:BTAD domain-containing putative transcriptional regulator [Sphaerisporangium sp. NPDC088356]|uniref:BTAD domain-containing putative transcriptional regulator n=1 Tax=Sphaerisporangium sp. NPDC088356 TaxID=3154871 RepID=UPI003418B4B2
MATPPVRPQERTASGILLGVLALVALLALVAGVPYALIRVFGSPLPDGGLSPDTLTRRLGPGAVLDMLSVLVWPVWLQLVACVVAELSAIRGTGAPPRIPFARGTQALIHRLATTASVLVIAPTRTTPPALVAGGPAGPEWHPGGRPDGSPRHADARVDTQAEDPEATRDLRGLRHRRGGPQPAVNAPGRSPASHETGRHAGAPLPSTAAPAPLGTAAPATPGFATAATPGSAAPGIPGVVAPATPGFAGAVTPGFPQARSFTEAELRAAVSGFTAAGSLSAAGLLAALGRRRRERLWTRPPGFGLPVPTGDATLAEVALRLAADQTGARLLDLGLRHLSKELAAMGRTPPTVYGAFLASTHIDLWIHPGDEDVPAPWAAVDGGRVWRLDALDGAALNEQAVAGTLAPYPGLVSIGTNESGRVLVDLETARGLIDLRGPGPIVAAALAAAAVELATSRWSDHVRLILVGFGHELAMVAPDRVTVAGSVAEVLPELSARTAQVRRAQAASGTDSALTGAGGGSVAAGGSPGTQGAHGEAARPTYLLSALAPTPEEAVRLAEAARNGTRMPSGYLVAGGGSPGSAWTWELTEEGRAGVKELGLDAAGQLLSERQYAQVAELFRTAVQGSVLPLPEPEPNGLAAAQLAPSFRPSAEVSVLGTVRVLTPLPLEEERVPICSELAAYLATHPGGVHPRALDGALWPGGVETAVRDAAIVRAQEWLGMDSAGRFNLYVDTGGLLRLGPEVRVDWQVFRELVRLARRDPANEAAALDDALALVRGPLAAGHPAERYLWLAGDPLGPEIMARVSDAAHRLCEVRMRAGDPDGAIGAALAGLRVSEGDEGLWRDLLRAAHATGDMGTLQLWVGTLRQRAAASQYWGRLVPETESLIAELLPSPP